jgi:hypothetical protein
MFNKKVFVSITTVYRRANALKTHHKVTLSGIVVAVATDIGREFVIDEAESLILNVIRQRSSGSQSCFQRPSSPAGIINEV